uniref:Uncharacterized protein n=1 Tax=Coccidioides posadasii RMSCC 3488 TaxID=454284 RepID=A0A0J6F3K5_COCPO|nr:hypothetical protein CPAG_00209 [Coccidioides posadasii RMSCC 3488]
MHENYSSRRGKAFAGAAVLWVLDHRIWATSARSISITPSPPEIPFHVDVGRIWSGAQPLLHLSCPEGTYPAGESVLEMNSQMQSSSRFSKRLCYNADFPPRNDLQPNFSHMTQFPVRVSVRQRHRVPER